MTKLLDKKPNDKEIVKALGRLSCKTLNDCKLINATIDLINHLQAENKRLLVELCEFKDKDHCATCDYRDECEYVGKYDFCENCSRHPYCLYLSPVCKKDYDIACDKFKRRCTNCPLPK